MASLAPFQPRIAVIGGGAIGGYVAARLAQAGRDVTLCVRTPIAQLIIDSQSERTIARPKISADPGNQSPAEWVFVATKAHDTASAAPWIKRLCTAASTLVITQNGIDHEARVRKYAGKASILPSVVYIGAECLAPGHILHHGGGKLVVPRAEAAKRLSATFQNSGIVIEETDDFTTAVWTKFLANVFGNPLTALTMRRLEVLREPAIQELARGLLEEAVTVGRACGARLASDQVEKTLLEVSNYPAEGGTSMLYDRLAGRSMEHDYMTGAVVRAAKQHGIDAPLNKAVLALLSALEAGLPPLAETKAQ
jgi:2-dehydropantoate 2-reductase